ncbi:hypothetical protein FF098_000105 [Parvularcula flava]|uniref:Uncharacterized protein n=1 Tax=Aquisalinus luteolus TaxID=1566827 RepID=A0ABX0HHD7_9PROT|nr:hypothetical protein [Aquisalinus luteolus]NHK26303.1 hypothetical protein [Aquisalinus luteolus]
MFFLPEGLYFHSAGALIATPGFAAPIATDVTQTNHFTTGKSLTFLSRKIQKLNSNCNKTISVLQHSASFPERLSRYFLFLLGSSNSFETAINCYHTHSDTGMGAYGVNAL